MARFIVVEFKGKGDPYFGGSADDRPLGKSGAFLTGCYVADRDVATFDSKAAALAAGEAAERRAGSVLGAWESAPRRLTCGCCAGGCVCWNHQDAPCGLLPATCAAHGGES